MRTKSVIAALVVVSALLTFSVSMSGQASQTLRSGIAAKLSVGQGHRDAARKPSRTAQTADCTEYDAHC